MTPLCMSSKVAYLRAISRSLHERMTTPTSIWHSWDIPHRRPRASSSPFMRPDTPTDSAILPGFVAPTLMARKIATFDHLTGGRLAVHIITGKTDEEQRGDGDFSPKAERYRRAAEYLELMKLTWSSERPFDFTGEFYRVSGAASDVRPLQQPHPLLFFGGASEGAISMGAKLCDVYAIYAEPLASTRERITQFRSLAAAFGRTPGFNVSLRPIVAAREGEAWDKANRILAAMSGKKGWQRQEEAKGPVDNAGQRLMRFALERDVHDERLWMPIARATGALGNTSCLVGTPGQVANAML